MVMRRKQNGTCKYLFCSKVRVFFSLSSAAGLKASSFLLHLSLFINVSVWKYPSPVMCLTDRVCLRVTDLRCGISHKHMSEEESK